MTHTRLTREITKYGDGRVWRHLRLSRDIISPWNEVMYIEVVDFESPQSDGSLTNISGRPELHPDYFVATARPDFEDGRHRRPTWKLADGIELPPEGENQ